jgi:hypothetical protein
MDCVYASVKRRTSAPTRGMLQLESPLLVEEFSDLVLLALRPYENVLKLEIARPLSDASELPAELLRVCEEAFHRCWAPWLRCAPPAPPPPRHDYLSTVALALGMQPSSLRLKLRHFWLPALSVVTGAHAKKLRCNFSQAVSFVFSCYTALRCSAPLQSMFFVFCGWFVDLAPLGNIHRNVRRVAYLLYLSTGATNAALRCSCRRPQQHRRSSPCHGHAP